MFTATTGSCGIPLYFACLITTRKLRHRAQTKGKQRFLMEIYISRNQITSRRFEGGGWAPEYILFVNLYKGVQGQRGSLVGYVNPVRLTHWSLVCSETTRNKRVSSSRFGRMKRAEGANRLSAGNNYMNIDALCNSYQLSSRSHTLGYLMSLQLNAHLHLL